MTNVHRLYGWFIWNLTVLVLLTVLIAVFDEYPKFLHAELHGGGVARHAAADADDDCDHGVDALVKQRHRGSAATYYLRSRRNTLHFAPVVSRGLAWRDDT